MKKAEKNSSKIGLTIVEQNGEWLGLSFTVSANESYFYYMDTVIPQNQQLSLFDTFKEENYDDLKEALKSLSLKANVATLDIKKQYPYMQTEDISKYFDVIIGAYLLNPLKSDYDGESIAAEHLNMTIPGQKEFFGKKTVREFAEENKDALAEYFMYQSYVAYAAEEVLRNKLQAEDMLSLMQDMEMPLSYVLFDMEREGITVREEELKEYSVY